MLLLCMISNGLMVVAVKLLVYLAILKEFNITTIYAGAEDLSTLSEEAAAAGESTATVSLSHFPHSIAARKGDGAAAATAITAATAAEAAADAVTATATAAAVAAAAAAAPSGHSTLVALERALRWLERQRQPDWSWGNETHRVIMTMQLANQSNELDNNQEASLEMQLSTKQLEIEILLMLSKHHESSSGVGVSAAAAAAGGGGGGGSAPQPLSRLSLYVCALTALCREPRAFHGRDLVAVLLHHEPQHDYDFAFGALAACAAGAHVRKRHIRRLLDIANAAADHNVDTIAMVILALRCIVQDHRHRNLLHFVRRPMAGLARQQQADGSFGGGGVATTALALQALQESEASMAGQQHYNRSAALAWLLARQAAEGAWGGDAAATAAAALALSPRGLAALRAMPCKDGAADARHDAQDPFGGDGGPKPPFPAGAANESDARNVSFTYTLWVGTNVTDNYTLYMIAPRNISFYHVMQMAAEQESKYEFSASEWPNGHYVHTLAGYKEEPMGYHYWLLYRLPEVPDPASPPGNQLVAPVGVDDLLVEEGEHYLFWYKKL